MVMVVVVIVVVVTYIPKFPILEKIGGKFRSY